jgi:NADH-quinone oxidoreductase subunit J
VHSVLFLILTFFNSAGLFLLTGAEFLAMILLVVYVGAVAVLFLFVVMMLDIDFAQMRSGILEYAPVGALVGLILAAELIVVLGGTTFAPEIAGSGAMAIPSLSERTNTAALGDVLYTDYIYFSRLPG